MRRRSRWSGASSGSAGSRFSSRSARSPSSPAYFVVTVTTAVRFGGLAAIVAVLTIALSYTAVVYYGNTVLGTALTLNDLTNLAMRTGFVALTGIFLGFLGDRARRAERALQEELERA